MTVSATIMSIIQQTWVLWLILSIVLISVSVMLYKYCTESFISSQRRMARPVVDFFTELSQGRSISYDKKLFSMLHSSLLVISEKAAVRGMSRCVSSVYGPLVSIDLSSCYTNITQSNAKGPNSPYYEKKGFDLKDMTLNGRHCRAFEGYGYFQKFPGVPIAISATWLVGRPRQKRQCHSVDGSSTKAGVGLRHNSLINKRPIYTSATAAADILSNIESLNDTQSSPYTSEDFVTEGWSIIAFHIEPPPNNTLDWASYCVPDEFDKFGDKFIMSLFSTYPQFAHKSMLGSLKEKYINPWVLADKVLLMEKAAGGLQGKEKDYISPRENQGKRNQERQHQMGNSTITSGGNDDTNIDECCHKELDYTLTKSYIINSNSSTGRKFQ